MFYRAFALMLLLPLVACNSPEGSVNDFCKALTQQKYGNAYDIYSKQDKKEFTKEQFENFEWDQERFDLRILRSYDLCNATPYRMQEDEGLVSLNLTKYGSKLTFECLVPVVKYDKWKVSNHWEPMEKFLTTLSLNKKTFSESFKQILPLPLESYKDKASEIITKYFKNIEEAKEKLAIYGGNTNMHFCAPNLNLNQGRDLIYDYLIFQEKSKGKSKDLKKAEIKRQSLIKDLQNGYDVIVSSQSQTTRVDLFKLQTLKNPENKQLNNYLRFAFWGEFKTPFTWKINIYEKGRLVQEGFGNEVEIIDDFDLFAPTGPNVTLGLIEFPLLPNYTEKLELVISGSNENSNFTFDIPISKEMLMSK